MNSNRELFFLFFSVFNKINDISKCTVNISHWLELSKIKNKKKFHIGKIGWARSESRRGGVEWENRRESDGKLNVDVFFTLGGIFVILIIG